MWCGTRGIYYWSKEMNSFKGLCALGNPCALNFVCCVYISLYIAFDNSSILFSCIKYFCIDAMHASIRPSSIYLNLVWSEKTFASVL